MQYKRGISGFAAVAALAFAGTACSSSGTTGATDSTGSGPAAAGARADALTVLAKMPAPQVVAKTTKAVSAKQTVKVHMAVKLPTMNETADGAISYGGAVKADLTVSMASDNPQVSSQLAAMGQMEMRMDSAVAYLNVGKNAELKSALGGKAWMKVDFAEIATIPELKSFSFMKDLAKNNDPGAQLHALLASPDLKMVGTEEHNGVQALHYVGDVSADDVVKATTAASGMTQADLDALKNTMTQGGVTKATYDLWIDADGLPVTVKFSENTNAGTVSGDISYSAWGTPVTATAPPADQTADVVNLMHGQ